MPEAPEPTRGPLFSEAQIRGAFVAGTVGMVALLVILLLLASARPQGRTAPVDTTQFDATVRNAGAVLDGFERVGEAGARIPIDRAMELVAERGVNLELATAEARAAEAQADDGGEPVAEGEDDAPSVDGAEVYASTCASCHQAGGTGIPGAFPPLADHAPELVAASGGREYLIHAVLHGVQGTIEVQGETYSGAMPAWGGSLDDAEVAAVLDYVLTEWDGEEALPDGFDAITADEVAELREDGLAPAEVLELRPDTP